MFILISPHYKAGLELNRFVVTAELPQFILDHGHIPLICGYSTSIDNSKEMLGNSAEMYFSNQIGGLILTGGTDVQIGQAQKLGHALSRDLFEIKLIQMALQAGLPILGICRGMQLLNVYFEGSLKNIQKYENRIESDLNLVEQENKDPGNLVSHSSGKLNSSEDLESYDLGDMHELHLSDTGMLKRYMSGLANFSVNSIHKQAIDKLGKGLEIEAKADDGIIEAVSNSDLKILGVQFHPEINLEKPEYKSLLECWLNLIPSK